MKLLRFNLENIYGVPDGAYELARPGEAPRDVVLFVGRAASGKTRVLEAIAALKEIVGGYGQPPPAASLLRSSATSGRIAATFRLAPDEMKSAGLRSPEPTAAVEIHDGKAHVQADPALRRLLAIHDRDPARGKFEYFPDNRSLFSARYRPPAPLPESATDMRARMTRDPEKYAWVRSFFAARGAEAEKVAAAEIAARGVALKSGLPDPLAPFRKALASFLPDVRVAEIAARGRVPSVWFMLRDGSTIELEELSASEQQAVLFCAAFVHLGLHRSVVLIDTPELYLHPEDHVRFFHGLVELGRDNQILAATASAPLLRAARSEELIDLSRRKLGG